MLSVSASKSMTHNSDSTLNLCLLFNLKFVCHVVSCKMPTHLFTFSVVLKHAFIFTTTNQLEKLEAARSADLWLPYLSVPFINFPYLYLPFITFPYLPYVSWVLNLTAPYLALLSLT